METFDLTKEYSSYPAEPLPYDGSLLHALEFLLPLVVTKTGHTLVLVTTRE